MLSNNNFNSTGNSTGYCSQADNSNSKSQTYAQLHLPRYIFKVPIDGLPENECPKREIYKLMDPNKQDVYLWLRDFKKNDFGMQIRQESSPVNFKSFIR